MKPELANMVRILALSLVFVFQWPVASSQALASSPHSGNYYMGAPATLVEAPNGAIANQVILDGIGEVGWTEPTIEQPVDGIWVFGGYGLAPIAVIDTDEGLIAFDTGDTEHDGELLLEAIRTVTDKPVKAIIYGHSHTVHGAGELHERVYDVMCSDDRNITDQHRCAQPVGNTVDVKTATYTNSIGEALMLAYWKDPDFDAGQRAFYYVRVLEIPTPNWTTYDAAFYNIDLPEGVEPTQQERAYTSPIWYTP